MPRVRILEAYCKGCELCVAACPCGVLEMSKEIGHGGLHVVRVVAESQCTACLNCTTMCPDAAIEVEVDEEATAART